MIKEKTCIGCNNWLEYSEFYSNKDGLQSYCIKCQSMRSKARYAAMSSYLDNYKLEQGCIDCGWNSFPEGLHFDHIDRSQKLYNISQMKLMSPITIKTEMAKCVVRCALCHAKKTKANQDYKRKFTP